MIATAEIIADALHARRTGPGRWMARCPAHDDRSPSLSITERGDKVLLHCFAGCDQQAVIEALRARGLWPERKPREYMPPRDYREERRRREFCQSAERWKTALLLILEHARADAWHDFLAGEASGNDEQQSQTLTRLLELAAEHRRIRNLNGAELLMAYSEAVERDGKAVAQAINYAMEDERHAREIAAACVAILAQAQAQERAGEVLNDAA